MHAFNYIKLKKVCFLLPLFLILVLAASAQQDISWKDLAIKAKKMESMVYRTTPDTSLKIYYQLPDNRKSDSKHPAIIWIHGGGWTSGAASVFFEHAAYFATRGVVGISIEYRLIGKNKTNTIASVADNLNKAFATFGIKNLGRINQAFIDFNEDCKKIAKF